MTEPIILKKLVCDDCEAYGAMFGGWSHSMTQLSAGRFGYTGWSIDLPGIRIYLDQHSRSIRWSEYCHVPVTAFFIPVSSDGPVRWVGRELQSDSVVIQGRHFEHSFSAGTSANSIYLDVDDGLIRGLGWNLPENQCVVLNRDCRKKLVQFCCALPSSQVSVNRPGAALELRDTILRLLEKALFSNGGELFQDGRKVDLTDYEIVCQAELIIARRNHRDVYMVDDLVHNIGVSKRSLYRAFENQLGLSPSRYMEKLRLKALRRHLLSPTKTDPSIAEAARVFGYSNPGRMARRYAEMFHEYPKETIARSKQVQMILQT